MTPQHDPSAFLGSDTSDRPGGDLLTRIDTYYDTAPRATARAEVHGSLVLFVAEQGWPFYARPNLARTAEPTVDEIKEVLVRQLELGMPRALEWIHETAPSLATVAQAAGMVGAFVNNVGAVGGGSHNPRGQVSEMVGVGVLPAFRRRGLGAAVAHLLSRHALDNGVTTVFCGADSSDVARVYEGVGFRRIGTTCIAGIS